MSKQQVREQRWRTAGHAAAGIFACALTPALAAADDKPAPAALDVRAAPHEGYGRLVFQAHEAGAEAVPMTAALDGTRLRITFAAPVSARLDAARTMLAGYLDGLALSADGMTVTAETKRPVELRPQKIGSSIELVDFYDRKPETVAGAAPAQPQPPAEKPAAAVQPAAAVKPEPPRSVPATVTVGRAADKALQVRFTPRDDGVSIRFEWSDPTAAAVFRRAGAVWAVFERTRTVDFTEFQPSLWPLVPAIAQVPSDGGTAIRLEAAAGYRPSVSRSGNSWVVELTRQASTIGEPLQPA
ncbi:MAG TPA: hypothetical protein VKS60_14750, partial [Stellaceae bacterium]|nr:hypothetical protein [Stellaceae bacterium]